MFFSSVLVVGSLAAGLQQTGQQPVSVAPPVAVDIATAPSGILLKPGDVAVSVDGRARNVISIETILRGPGSDRGIGGSGPGAAPPLAEPSRTIIIAIDQTSLSRGSEKKMSAMIARVLDLIAPADQAALIPLPLQRSAVVAVGTDRRAMWATLAKIRIGSSSAPLALARAEDPPPLPDDETHEIRNPTGEEPPSRTPQRDRQPEAALRPDIRQSLAERAPGPLDDLRGLLASVRSVPGAKTILVIRGTAPPGRESELGEARLDSAGLLPEAAATRATIHVVTLGDRWRGNVDELARVARMTGGDEFRMDKQAATELERLGTRLAEGLRIAIEGAPGDLDGRAHTLAIVTTRPGVAIRCPERWVPFEAHQAVRFAAAPPALAEDTPNTPGRKTTTGTIAGSDGELQRVLARMSSYASQYVDEFTAVVAEETYQQRVDHRLEHGPQWRPVSRRELRSDFLVVRLSGKDEWMPFRDVFEVDGKPIRDRDDRLRKLFIEMPPDAMDTARRILDEGARFNIGRTYRNVNLPVLPLVFLKPESIGRLQFRHAGEDTIQDVRVWQIDFHEFGHPTVIRNDLENRDIPTNGSFWVDPITGRIVKTRIKMRDPAVTMETTVLYRRSDTLHLWAPAEMSELYVSGGEQVAGTAKYKNFRRFRVEVEEKIAVPKG